MKLESVEALMKKPEVRGQEDYGLQSSSKRFPDGGSYRMEISGVERPSVLEATIDEMSKRKVPIHRMISVVMGATLLNKQELKDLAQMVVEAKLEVILTPASRAPWALAGSCSRREGILRPSLPGIRELLKNEFIAIVMSYRHPFNTPRLVPTG
jgi:hypothetical protein